MKERKYRVVLADDHDIIRQGIKSILLKEAEYDVVGEANNGEQVIPLVESKKPDLLLLDITMPKISGLDLIEQALYIHPPIKILIISMHRAEIYVNKALKLGVKGYINKDNVVEDLIPALRRICRGEVYISSKISQMLMEKVAQTNPRRDKNEIALSERESDVIRLVVEGKTSKEIADILFISRRTVENHKNNLLKKLNLHRTSELIKYAIQHKIVDLE